MGNPTAGGGMKTVTTKFSDEFVAAVVEIARIFGEEADFGAIVEKTVGVLSGEHRQRRELANRHHRGLGMG